MTSTPPIEIVSIINDPVEVVSVVEPPDLIYTSSLVGPQGPTGPVGAAGGVMPPGGTAVPPARLYYYNVQDYGAVGNGTTDDGPAIQATVNAAGAGHTVMFPPTPAGYLCNASITVPSNIAITGHNTYILNGSPAGGLFALTAVTNVTIAGFHIVSKDSTPRQAVRILGANTNIRIRDVWCENHVNFSMSVGTAGSSYNGLYFDNIRITGPCGLAGTGSGIDCFPQAQVGGAGSLPLSRDLHVNNMYIDVSNANATVAQHGPQCFKVSNTIGVYLNNMELVGGSVASLVITNGSRVVRANSIHCRYGNRGADLTATPSGGVTSVAADWVINGLSYDPEGVGGVADYYGARIGQVADLTLDGFNLAGSIAFLDDKSNLPSPTGKICNGVIRTAATGSATIQIVAPSTAVVNNVTNTVNAQITTGAVHNLYAGQKVFISGVGGATGVNSAAGTPWVVQTVIDANNYTINNPSAPGVYTSAGTQQPWLPDINSFHIHHVTLAGPAAGGTGAGRLILSQASWRFSQSQIDHVILVNSDSHGILLTGTDNLIHHVTSIGGNPRNIASAALIFLSGTAGAPDSCSRNTIGDLSIVGPHNVTQFLVANTGAGGVSLTGYLKGPISSSSPVLAANKFCSCTQAVEAILVDVSGPGSPAANVQAAIGSRYWQTDSTAGLYLKQSGSGAATGWTAVTVP
jgi:hypothetical protein